MSNPDLETLVSLSKRRGFIFPASEIYGGISGFYDYGPYGVLLANKLKNAWWDSFVRKSSDIFGLDSAIIQNPKLWQASGHVDGFNDPMAQCLNCNHRQRADHLVDEELADISAYDQKLKDVSCPSCKEKGKWDEVKTFNMMFKTTIGSTGGSDSETYLRPETAGGIFTNFEQVREVTRAKLPFGIAQIGKAFRNEISPREFLFRVREFEQMEIEYFVDPKDSAKFLEDFKKRSWDWLIEVGLDKSKLKWHQHSDDERAHYSSESWDINYQYSFGSKELWGIANRGDYDLTAHSKGSGKELNYFDPEKEAHIVPHVIEPSIGVDRLFLALIDSVYKEETVNDETRVVLKFPKILAPVDVAVLPLSKKPELSKLSRKIFDDLVSSTNYYVEYDETQSIGKRYRRQDEIGTPLCLTIDFDSLEDQSVTIRDRDSMEQKRVKIDKLVEELEVS